MLLDEQVNWTMKRISVWDVEEHWWQWFGCICVVAVSLQWGSLWLLDRVGPQPRRSVWGRMGLLGSRRWIVFFCVRQRLWATHKRPAIQILDSYSSRLSLFLLLSLFLAQKATPILSQFWPPPLFRVRLSITWIALCSGQRSVTWRLGFSCCCSFLVIG